MKTLKRLIGVVLIACNAFAAHATTLNPVQLLNPTGSSSGQAIVSTGSSSAPAWGGIGVNGIAAIAANTVLANATGSSASPTAFAMPSCSTSASALDWTSGTGFTCNTSINAATLGGATFASPGPIGSTTASTGSFTTLSASSTISGTGFSTYLASPPSIGATSPNTGTFTTLAASGTVSGAGFSAYLASPPAIGNSAAASGKFTTLQATSTITPSTTAGIVGTTAADNANAGSDGEYFSSTSSAISLTTSTATTITSLSLTAGDWDITGNIDFVGGSGAICNTVIAAISTTAATFPAIPLYGISTATLATGASGSMAAPIARLNVSATTTVYLIGSASFTGGTMTGTGIIRARRIR